MEWYGSIHNHSEYSNFRLRDSINRIADMVNYAMELGHNFIAITEHETIASALEAQKIEKQAREKDPSFKIIRGNEIYLCRNGLNQDNFIKGEDKYFHFILLAKDEIGHKQIREISTRAWLRSYKGRGMVRVPTYYQDLIDIIQSNQGHIIGSTACFRKGTLVLTMNGEKKIEDIKPNDYILNRYGNWEKVNFPTHRVYNGLGKEIRFLGNPTPTICTDNHQFLVTTANKIRSYKENGKNPLEWVEAKNLNISKGGEKYICVCPVNVSYTNATKYDNKKFIKIDETLYEKIYIKEIKNINLNETVYCLNVDSHSFCCNGVIVHNCMGSQLGQFLLKYKETNDKEYFEKAQMWVDKISQIFGKENFFLETQPSNSDEQVFINQNIKIISENTGFPVVISLDAHYLKKEDINIHKAFLNAQDGDRETESFYATTYIMSREEIHEYMDKYLGKDTVSQWMNNTKLIYDMCEDYDLTKPLRIPYLPRTIDKITDEEYNEFKNKITKLSLFYNSKYDSDRHLAAAIVRKIKNDRVQYDNEETYKEIDLNLDVIWLSSEKQNTRWSAYLLNMRDYIDVIWNEGDSLVGRSRGSGGGFILLNILGITQINPLREKTKTFYWRFLNPERVSPLDIDTDIEGGKREQVYQAFQKIYGEDRVSKVLTLRTEKSKSALLTAVRGLGLTPEEGSYLSSFIVADRGQARTLSQTYYGDKENDIAPNKQFKNLMDGQYSNVWEVAQKIEGLINGVGRHNCSL